MSSFRSYLPDRPVFRQASAVVAAFVMMKANRKTLFRLLVEGKPIPKGARLAAPEWAIAIRETRQALKMSQVEFATRLGVSQSAVTDWERGRAKPRHSFWLPISQILDPTNPDTPRESVTIDDRAEMMEDHQDHKNAFLRFYRELRALYEGKGERITLDALAWQAHFLTDKLMLAYRSMSGALVNDFDINDEIDRSLEGVKKWLHGNRHLPD